MNMPKPTDALGIRRLQGTVGYLGKFLPNLSAAIEPLCKLSYMDAELQWLKEQDDALEEVKKLVTEARVLAYYEKKELMVECDASSNALGAALLRDDKPAVLCIQSPHTNWATLCTNREGVSGDMLQS